MSKEDAPILCLASWYPNELDAYEGDFIERKMKALAIYRKVEVLHVKKHSEVSFNKKKSEHANGHLKATVIYQKNTSEGILNSIKNYYSLIKTHNSFLKVFITKHKKPKVILVQVPYNAGIIAWYWKLRYNIPYILTEHYGIYNEHYEQHFNTRSWLYKHVVKKIVSQAEKLVTVSHSLANDMNNWVVKKEHTKISNVVDTHQFIYQPKPVASPFIFCHLSNMIPVKNVTGIIDAVHLLSKQKTDFVLNLVGSKNQDHIAQAKELGLLDRHIFFKDVISYTDVASTLQQSHALVMFSNTESQSCISLEALCTGTPVISSKAGGIEEHLDNSNSILIERGDTHALAQAMSTMIDNYSNFNQEEIALKNQKQWNFETIGAQYNELIEHVLSQ